MSEPRHATGAVTDMLNELLGAFWGGIVQHQAHVALLDSWGLAGLAADMRERIADEPETVERLMERLLALDGRPTFTVNTTTMGENLRAVLDSDLQGGRAVRPALNGAAEVAGAAHDATTRVLIETILADEEKHASWLQTELDLLDLIGEPLYVASHIHPDAT